MAFIASTFTALTGGKGAFSGIIAWINETWGVGKRIHFPPNCSAVESHPSGDNYVNRQYLVGGHTRNIVIDENFRAHVQGIRPPAAPTVSSGAGAVGQIGYLRFYDEITGERSSLSAGTVFTGDENRSWTALPADSGEVIVINGTVDIASGEVSGVGGATNLHSLRPGDRIAVSTDLTRWAQVQKVYSGTYMTIDDDTMAGSGVSIVVKPVRRVSHIELWASVSGTLPRFILRARIGTTAITESVAALALGEAFIDSYEPMPKGTYNVIYNSRQLVAGVAGQLDRVFISQVGFPERYAGLNFQVKYGETIVGLVRTRDYTIVLCPKSSYRLQGFSDTDFTLTVLEPEIGGLGHGGNAVCGGRIFVPSREQIQYFDGAFHDAISSRQSEWTKNVRENEDAYQGGIGMVDPDSQTYRYLPFPVRITVEESLEASVPSATCPAVGVIDFTAIQGTRAYLVKDFGVETKLTLFVFSPNQSPALQISQQFDTGNYPTILFDGGYIWIASVATDVSAVQLWRMDRGGIPELVASLPITVSVYPQAIVRYQNELYISVEWTGPAVIAPDFWPSVLRYNGSPTLIIEDYVSPLPINNYAEAVALGADLYVFGGESGACRRKSAGVWSDVVTTPPMVVSESAVGGVVYGDAIYTYQLDGSALFTISGSVVTMVHPIASAYPPNTFAPIRALAVFNGYLYYINVISYGIADSPAPGVLAPRIEYHVYLGRFDGTTWDDLHKDLSAQFTDIIDVRLAGGVDICRALFLREFEGSLRLAITKPHTASGVLCFANWYSSPGIDTGGSWISHEVWSRSDAPGIALRGAGSIF